MKAPMCYKTNITTKTQTNKQNLNWEFFHQNWGEKTLFSINGPKTPLEKSVEWD